MALKITIAILKAVAEEFNKVMKFEVPIETGKSVKLAGIQADVIEAAKELAPDDKLSDESIEALTALGVKLPSADAKTKPAAKKPAAPKAPRYSRIDAAVEAIGAGNENDNLVPAANQLYQDNGNGKDNENEAKWAVNMVNKVMTSMRNFKVKA